MNGSEIITLPGGAEAIPIAVPIARPIFFPVSIEPPPHPMMLATSTRGQAIVDVLKLFAVLIVTSLALEVAAGGISEVGWVADERILRIAATLVVAIILLIAIRGILRRRGQTAASVGLCVSNGWFTALYGLVAVGGAYAIMIATNLLTLWLYPAGYEALTHNQERLVESFPKLAPPLLVALGIVVGFYEEVICRGFLLTRLRRATGSATVAVVVSSLLFALPHAGTQELITVVPLFLIAVFWSVLTLWGRSIVPAIIGHALFDIFSLVALYFFSENWQ